MPVQWSVLKSFLDSEYCKIFKSTYFEELYIKKRDFSASISGTSENVCFYFMIDFLRSLRSHTIFF